MRKKKMSSTKEKLLELFAEQNGLPLSGTEAAEKIGVSRTAVWKAVESLRKNGYPVTGSTNKGYVFKDGHDFLNAARITSLLSPLAFSLCSGKIKVFKTIDSTNTEAKRKLSCADADRQALHGAVFIAEHQSAGRGRMGRSFYSPERSGIYLSIVYVPDDGKSDAYTQNKPPEPENGKDSTTGAAQSARAQAPDTSLLTALAASAVCRALDCFGVQSQIKWVNDIFVRGKKVCGILTEGIVNMERRTVDAVVVGIGINVKTGKDGFPEELRHIAGSLIPEQDKKTLPSAPAAAASATLVIDRNELAAAVISELLGAFSGNTPFVTLMQEYKKRSLILGKKICVASEQGEYTALAVDITDEAHLIVETENKEQKELLSGEVRIVI